MPFRFRTNWSRFSDLTAHVLASHYGKVRGDIGYH